MSGTKWSEDRKVWADLAESIRTLDVDELVVLETERLKTARSTARRIGLECGFRLHMFTTETKLYVARTG